MVTIRNLFKSNFVVLFSLIFLVSTEYTYANKNLKGFEIGNPDAPITIIEYRSLTCSHCADFSTNVFPLFPCSYQPLIPILVLPNCSNVTSFSI